MLVGHRHLPIPIPGQAFEPIGIHGSHWNRCKRSLIAKLGSGRNLGFLLIVAALALVALAFRSYVPVWDGNGYALCAVERGLFPFSIQGARCFGHPSIAYTWYLRAFDWISPGNVALQYLANIVLVVAAAGSLRRLHRELFAGSSAIEEAFFLALFAFSPLLLVHAFHIAPDFAVPCFLAMYLSLLVRKKFVLASLAGVALSFSKEVGAGVYVASLATLPLLEARSFFSRSGTRSQALFLAHRSVLLLPLILIGWYVIAFSSGESRAAWEELDYGMDLLRTALAFDLLDHSFASFLFNAFALNFQWMLSLTVIAASLVALLRIAAGTKTSSREDVARVLFFAALTVAAAYIVTRVRPFNNGRYVLACLPLLLILFQYSLKSLCRCRKIREGFVSMIAMLVIASNILTIDPVSMAFYGVFDAGGTPMLKMNKPGSGTGLGRDEVAYNLQFVSLTDSIRRIVEIVKPTEKTILLSGWGLGFRFPQMRRTDGSLVLQGSEDTFPLWVIEDTEWVKSEIHAQSGPMYFIEFPNLDNVGMREVLQEKGELQELHPGMFFGRGVRLYAFIPRQR